MVLRTGRCNAIPLFALIRSIALYQLFRSRAHFCFSILPFAFLVLFMFIGRRLLKGAEHCRLKTAFSRIELPFLLKDDERKRY